MKPKNNEYASLPIANEAEDAILGTILSDPDGYDIAVEAGATSDIFVNPSNKALFDVVCDSKNKGNPIDLISISTLITEATIKEHLLHLIGQSITHDRLQYYVFVVRELAMRRSIIEVCSDTIRNATDTLIGFDEIVGALSGQITTIMEQQITTPIITGREVVNDVIAHMETIHFADGPTGILSGIPALDNITLGWQDTDLIVVAARPSVGKTAIGMSFAMNAIANGVKVGFFSLEMANRQIGFRLVASRTGIPGTNLRGEKELTQDQWNLVHGLQAADNNLALLLQDDTPRISLPDFQAKARKMVMHYGVRLIIIDYLQLMTTRSQNKSTREQEVAEISNTLKATAKKLNIPIIALAQLSRDSDKFSLEPRLCDLRESGAIEQDADIVILMSKCSEDSRNLNVAKNRNGATGQITVMFDPYTTSFLSEETSMVGSPQYNSF